MNRDSIIKLNPYEKGLIITLINQAENCGDDFTPDDLKSLREIKKRLMME